MTGTDTLIFLVSHKVRGGLPLCVWLRRGAFYWRNTAGYALRGWGSAIIFVLCSGCMGNRLGQLITLFVLNSIYTTVKGGEKNNSPTKGSGLLWESLYFVCAVCDSVFFPSCSFGPKQGFLWPVLNKASLFPCKADFSSKFTVYTAAKMLVYNCHDL